NCCGATAYMSVDEQLACVLAARNLALAEKAGSRDLITPCSACYLVLNKTKHYIEDSPPIRAAVERGLSAAGLTCEGTTNVRHPLDVLVNDIGLDVIKEKVVRPLRS